MSDPPEERVERRLAAIERALARLENRLAALEGGPAGEAAAVRERLERIQAALTAPPPPEPPAIKRIPAPPLEPPPPAAPPPAAPRPPVEMSPFAGSGPPASPPEEPPLAPAGTSGERRPPGEPTRPPGEWVSLFPRGAGTPPWSPPPTGGTAVPPARESQEAKPAAADDLESRVAGQWFNYIGAVALVIAVALALKFAYDQGWFTPLMLCAAGWILGAGMLAAGEALRPRLSLWGQVATGMGAAVLYVSTFAGHVVAEALSPGVAVLLLIAISGLTVALSLWHDSVPIASLGTLLGYLTPVLAGGDGGGTPAGLFTYLVALSLAVLGISVARPWSGFRLAAFAGTWLIFLGWYLQSYQDAFLGATVLFLSLIFFAFLFASVANALLFGRDASEVDLPLMVLNPAAYGWLVFLLLGETHPVALGAGAAAFAGGYWLLGRLLAARTGTAAYLAQLATGIGHVFAILALPLLLRGQHLLTAAWAAQGGSLLLVAARTGSAGTRWWGIGAVLLAAGWLLLREAWVEPSPGVFFLFSERAFAFQVLLAALLIGLVTRLRSPVAQGFQPAAPGPLSSTPQGETPAADGGGLEHELSAGCWALAAGTLLFGWIALEPASLNVKLVLWASAAALALGFGWQQRSLGVRAAGYLLGWGAGLLALGSTLAAAEFGLPGWEAAGAGLLASSLFFTVASAPLLRRGGAVGEAALAVALLGSAAVLLLIYAYFWQGIFWFAVLASLVTAALLATGALSDRPDVRALAFLSGFVPSLALVLTGLEGSAAPSAPGLAATIALFAGMEAFVSRSPRASEGERQVGGFFGALALALAFWWAHLALASAPATAVWALLAAAAYLAGRRLEADAVRAVAAGGMLLTAGRVLLLNHGLEAGEPLLLHGRSLAAAAALAGCAALAGDVNRRPAGLGALGLVLAWVAAGLGLWWASVEAMDAARRFASEPVRAEAAGFALSAAWAVFAAGAIGAGFRFRSRSARLAGLGLLSVTIFKVFLWDVAALGAGYQILSFTVLGAILLGVAYAYQRFQERLVELLVGADGEKERGSEGERG